MMFQMLRTFGIAAILALALPSSGQAADLPPAPESTSDWTFTAAAYLWASGLNGDVGVFGLPAQNVDLSFSDLLQNLDGAVMGLGEARNGRFALGMDVTYTKVGASVKTPYGNIDASATSWMVTGFGGYSVFQNDIVRLDAIAGGRLWSVNNDFDIKSGEFDGRSFSDGATWVDPLVGAKLRLDLAPNVYATSWAFVGGFGVGSDLMWDLMAGAGYQFNDTFSLFAGYRATSVDYSHDGFVYDVVQKGPVLAGAFQF